MEGTWPTPAHVRPDYLGLPRDEKLSEIIARRTGLGDPVRFTPARPSARCSTASPTSARDGSSSSGRPTVADEIEQWLDEVDVDGINLRQYHTFDTARDFIELVVPVLQERGRLRSSYDETESLRDRIFGEGDRLPDRHHGMLPRWRAPSRHLHPVPFREQAAAERLTRRESR